MKDKVLERLDHMMEFQLNDLRKASILATANFLVAVGCMNTIEFLGGVSNGLLGQFGKVESRFKEGVRLLGLINAEYASFGENRMYALRNGLTHQYVPGLKGFNSIIITNDWSAIKAIHVSDAGRTLRLNVARLGVDLGVAWGLLRSELLRNKRKRGRAASALRRLPQLL